MRRPHYLEVKYRGGAECWWEVRYGGRTTRVQGYLQLHDVMVLALSGQLASGDST